VRQVEYITSRGQNVRTIVTEACVFERSGAGEPWLVKDLVPARAGLLKELASGGFRFAMQGPPPAASPAGPRELELLSRLRSLGDARKPRVEAAVG
jgi:hypothetical protein